MSNENERNYYNTIKNFKGRKYVGMRVGGRHCWNYNDGIWKEVKLSPDEWKFEFNCYKTRSHQAPPGSGAKNNTQYHWYILADQKVVKIDENTYSTIMKGSKFKIGHKMPNWKKWSYESKELSYEDKIIQVLKEIIERLESKKREKQLIRYLTF
ncbi:MAG: hypothetical protein ACTSPY_16485 [Candidatus Helarchaeota archaeon]